jgi:hypothetical protein
MRLTVALVVLLAAASLGLATGCGDDDESAAPTTGAATDEQPAGGNAADADGEEARDAGDAEEADGDGGGGGGGQGAGGQSARDRTAIERNAVTVVQGGDPEVVCEELATESFVRSAYGSLQGCRDAVVAQRAFDVRVAAVEIDGATATATVIPVAGPNEGERLTAELALESGVWKVDALRSDAPVGP